MSHFTVMVIGEDPETQLQPYHEYECTGTDDEYVIDVDQTEEVEEWLEETIWVGLTKDTGEPDYQFSKEAAEKHLNDVQDMPRMDWYKSQGKDINVEVVDWFGTEVRDGKHYRHTNPNAKWDWYQVGGRWAGFFKLKDADEFGEMGERSWANPGPAEVQGYADVTTKGEIDIEGMMAITRKEKNEQFDHLVAAMGDVKPVSWAALREEHENIDDAREAYKNSDFKKAIDAYEADHEGVHLDGWIGDMYVDYYLHLPLNQARVRYVETAAMNILTPYAFIKDSQWVQKGDMGWWGMSSNEKDKDEWAQQFYKMFSELPDDTLLTMVDCHI